MPYISFRRCMLYIPIVPVRTACCLVWLNEWTYWEANFFLFFHRCYRQTNQWNCNYSWHLAWSLFRKNWFYEISSLKGFQRYLEYWFFEPSHIIEQVSFSERLSEILVIKSHPKGNRMLAQHGITGIALQNKILHVCDIRQCCRSLIILFPPVRGLKFPSRFKTFVPCTKWVKRDWNEQHPVTRQLASPESWYRLKSNDFSWPDSLSIKALSSPLMPLSRGVLLIGKPLSSVLFTGMLST